MSLPAGSVAIAAAAATGCRGRGPTDKEVKVERQQATGAADGRWQMIVRAENPLL